MFHYEGLFERASTVSGPADGLVKAVQVPVLRDLTFQRKRDNV